MEVSMQLLLLPWTACLGVLLLCSPALAEEPLRLPADPQPVLVAGTALWEDSIAYRVTLEFEAQGREPVRVEFIQDNRTRDLLRLHMHSPGRLGARAIDELHALDADYKLFGFLPLRDGEVIGPSTPTGGWRLVENRATFRQICGGFSLSPLLGDAYRIPTGHMFRILKAIGSPMDEPRQGSIVVFYDKTAGSPEATAGHYAIVESTPAVAGNLLSHAGTVILTKNQDERAYRGDLAEFVAGGARGASVQAPAHRMGKWNYLFWSVPWAQVNVRRLGGPFAEDAPVLHTSTTTLRVQVVDARTYALVGGARLRLRFPRAADLLADVRMDATGVHDFRSVPGSSGRYEVLADAPGFREALLTVKIDAGQPANVILPLQPDDVETANLRSLFADIEDSDVRSTILSRRMAESGTTGPALKALAAEAEVAARLHERAKSLVAASPQLRNAYEDLTLNVALRAAARATVILDGKPDPEGRVRLD
jgi:hypothetical protein